MSPQMLVTRIILIARIHIIPFEVDNHLSFGWLCVVLKEILVFYFS